MPIPYKISMTGRLFSPDPIPDNGFMGFDLPDGPDPPACPDGAPDGGLPPPENPPEAPFIAEPNPPLTWFVSIEMFFEN